LNDFSKPLVQGISTYGDRPGGIPRNFEPHHSGQAWQAACWATQSHSGHGRHQGTGGRGGCALPQGVTMNRRFALLGLVLALVAPATHAAEPVDMLLVLAADVSRSVTEPKFKLQREGAAAAIAHPDVVKAITSGPHRRIAVCFVEWATIGQQGVVIDWTMIDGEAAARSFGGRLVEAPRSFVGSTSISGAIDFSVRQLERAPFTADRRVIDISGDGNNNSGRPVTEARDEALAKDITINALVILTPLNESFRPEHTNPPGGLEKYFKDNVIAGPGSFTVAAESHDDFGRALTKKLIQEIALREANPPHSYGEVSPSYGDGGAMGFSLGGAYDPSVSVRRGLLPL